MHSKAHMCLLSAIPLISSITSLPLLPQELALRPRAKYSVVAVDGSTDGEPTTVASPESLPETTIITHTLEQTQTVTASTKAPPTSVPDSTSTGAVEDEVPVKTVKVFAYENVKNTKESAKKGKVEIVNVDGVEPGNSISSTIRSSTISTTFTSANRTVTTSSSSQAFTTSVLRAHETVCDDSASTPTISTSASPVTITATSSSSTRKSPSNQPSLAWPGAIDPPKVVLDIQQNYYVPDAPPSITPPASTSSHSYDNGMWHTTYPPWNATTTVKVSISPSATPVYHSRWI